VVERVLLPQHERLIARARERYSQDPELLALVVGGSVAHGLATPSSDLDVMLVLSEEELAARLARGELTVYDDAIADYEGGYLDGKMIALSFIDEVADHGSEPARWAFDDAFVAFSRVDGLEERLAAAARYPEEERDEKLRDFVSHVMLMEWYMREAENRSDRYLATFAGSRLALYAGRAVLAVNRMLYPYHKWFLWQLGRAPEKPPGLLEAIDAVIERPGLETAVLLASSVTAFADLGLEMREAVIRFMRRSEWNWRFGPAPLEDA
jgi:predicted nucleotidyltransferase